MLHYYFKKRYKTKKCIAAKLYTKKRKGGGDMYSLKDDMPSIPEQYMSLAIKTKPGVFASMLT